MNGVCFMSRIVCCGFAQDRVSEVNAQVEKFVTEKHFDIVSIQKKQASINQRYTR